MLFGTNYPMIGHAHALDGLDGLGLTDDGRRDYLHANAERVFTFWPVTPIRSRQGASCALAARR